VGFGENVKSWHECYVVGAEARFEDFERLLRVVFGLTVVSGLSEGECEITNHHRGGGMLSAMRSLGSAYRFARGGDVVRLRKGHSGCKNQCESKHDSSVRGAVRRLHRNRAGAEIAA